MAMFSVKLIARRRIKAYAVLVDEAETIKILLGDSYRRYDIRKRRSVLRRVVREYEVR